MKHFFIWNRWDRYFSNIRLVISVILCLSVFFFFINVLEGSGFLEYGFILFVCCTIVAQDDWNGTQRAATAGKAVTPRQTKGAYREHPYGRYWPLDKHTVITHNVPSWRLSPTAARSLSNLTKVIVRLSVSHFCSGHFFFLLEGNLKNQQLNASGTQSKVQDSLGVGGWVVMMV